MNAHIQAALAPPEGLTPEEWPAYLAWLAGHAEEAEEGGEEEGGGEDSLEEALQEEERKDRRGNTYCVEKGRGRVPCNKAKARPDRTASPEKLQAAQEQLSRAKTAADVERILDGHNHATLKLLARALAQKAHGGSKAIARRIAQHLNDRGEDNGLPRSPEPGRVYNARTEHLKVDPTRFQYKLNTNNPAGVTDEMKSVKTWNPDFAGVISVWKDPETGETFVVNGHHRHELASRLGADTLAVRYVKAATAKEARAVGALINIAEGRGTAVDAAKFLRDSGLSIDDLAGAGVSLRGKVAADAAVLTKLNDRLFDRVARGLMDDQQAMAVARHLADPDLQDQLVGLLEKREADGKDTPTKVVEEMAREMASTPTTTRTERSLFGDIESTESLFVPRNELKAHIRSELAREVNDFAAVASKRRATRVAGAGNTLDVDRNKEIAEQAERARNAFDQLVNRKGGISDALNRSAAEYANARTKKEKERARAAAYEAVRQEVFAEAGIESAGTGGATPASQPGRGDARPGGLKKDDGLHRAAAILTSAAEPSKPPEKEPAAQSVAQKWYHNNSTLDDVTDPVQQRKAVERAVAGGVTVPPEVLAEHPGITRESARKAVREDRVADALNRYDSRGSLRGERGALFGGDDLRSRERFHLLPHGTEVVVTDGAHRGRTGKLLREKSLDGSERTTLQLDGEDDTIPVSHDAIEPLDDRLSWRTAYGAAPKGQEGLFDKMEYRSRKKFD